MAKNKNMTALKCPIAVWVRDVFNGIFILIPRYRQLIADLFRLPQLVAYTVVLK